MTIKELFTNVYDNKMKKINNMADWEKKHYVKAAEQFNITIEELVLINEITITEDEIRKYSLFAEVEELKTNKIIATNNTHKSMAITTYHLTKKGIKKFIKGIEF